MFRSYWRVIALTAMVAGSTAHAADTTLTLACEGTKTETFYGRSERRNVSLSIIINFAARTVTGFREEERLVELTIDDISETTISFAGSNSAAMVSYNMNGTIDRVTGTVEAGLTSFPEEGHGLKTWTSSYALKCKPAQRMF
jgi:hypothetical protein